MFQVEIETRRRNVANKEIDFANHQFRMSLTSCYNSTAACIRHSLKGSRLIVAPAYSCIALASYPHVSIDSFKYQLCRVSRDTTHNAYLYQPDRQTVNIARIARRQEIKEKTQRRFSDKSLSGETLHSGCGGAHHSIIDESTSQRFSIKSSFIRRSGTNKSAIIQDGLVLFRRDRPNANRSAILLFNFHSVLFHPQ